MDSDFPRIKLPGGTLPEDSGTRRPGPAKRAAYLALCIIEGPFEGLARVADWLTEGDRAKILVTVLVVLFSPIGLVLGALYLIGRALAALGTVVLICMLIVVILAALASLNIYLI